MNVFFKIFINWQCCSTYNYYVTMLGHGCNMLRQTTVSIVNRNIMTFIPILFYYGILFYKCTPLLNQKLYYLLGRKEGNVLFNDTLNTFYGVRHMVKDHSDSERGNPLPPHGLLFSISSNGFFICIILDMITHTTAFVTPVVQHWLE